MDIILVAISLLTVVLTMSIGYLIIQTFFPNKDHRIEISDAFNETDYDKVVQLTEGKEHTFSHSSLSAYIHAAQARSKLAMFEEAIKWWEIALIRLELSTNDKIFVELEIGDCFLAINDLKQSEMHYRIATALDKKHEKANHKLAYIFYCNNIFDMCRKILIPVLKNNPALIDSRKLYAECLASLGLYAKAIRHYNLLERKQENIITYNYAKTLTNLKVWDKAYDVYTLLLEKTQDQHIKEFIICELVSICISMKKYHESLGMIDSYLNQVNESETKLNLKYMRASIFSLRGDHIIALREYKTLHQENPLYKDLDNIMLNNEKWLDYPFLSNYYTSNESLFESLITRLAIPGLTIFRRTASYVMGVLDNKVCVFYREMREINDHFLKEIDTQIIQNLSHIEEVEIWSLEGKKERHAQMSYEYRIVFKSDDEFLVQVNLAVATIDHIEGGQAMNFVEGMRNLPEIIPKIESDTDLKFEPDVEPVIDQNIDPIVENILNKQNNFLDDELLSKALEQ
ncbi:MAG: hypothetical protein KFW21_04535 [Spirochaetota bacterium]|nr:hypothetical protein [Spirochaetota bacterium]